jgi:hypothetical protein
MKRQLTLYAITGLLACGSSLAKADLLSNGNLDSVAVGPQTLATPVGWGVNSFRPVTGPFPDGCSSETFANVLAPGGFGLFFKAFQGVTTNKITVDLYQNNPGTPGVDYTLTGWAGAEANYIGLTDSTVKSEFHLTFLGSTSNILGSATLDLVAAGLGVGAPTPPASGFAYHPFTLSAVAPAGTVTVQAGAIMIDAYNNPLGGGQAFVVDSFTLVPEPSVISLAVLGMAGVLAFRRRR